MIREQKFSVIKKEGGNRRLNTLFLRSEFVFEIYIVLKKLNAAAESKITC